MLKNLAMIKDLLLIHNCLPVNIWTETINIANYLQNQLPTKRSKDVFILEEAQINTRQNLKYPQIFRSKMSTFIPNEKHIKSDE